MDRFIHGLAIPVDVHQVEQRFRVLLRQLDLDVKLLQLVKLELFGSEQNTAIIVATICSYIYIHIHTHTFTYVIIHIYILYNMIMCICMYCSYYLVS